MQQQPDYPEAADQKVTRAQGKSFQDNLKETRAFEDFMQDVWKAQKEADSKAGKYTGDMDGDKAFAGQRAPMLLAEVAPFTSDYI